RSAASSRRRPRPPRAVSGDAVTYLGLLVLCTAADPAVLGRPLPRWVEDLGHDSAQVRRGAAFALGQAGTAAAFAVPQLVRALGDAEPGVREAAAQAIA